MRWSMCWSICFIAFVLLSLLGCERIQRGEFKNATQKPRVEKLAEKAMPPEEKPTERKMLEIEQKAQPEPEQPKTTEQKPVIEAIPQQPTQPQVGLTQPIPTPTEPVTKPEVTRLQQPIVTETVAMSFPDEARSVRASIDALHSQFDKLTVGEIRSRLLLLNQAISELEVRSPALVLWRTSLKLEMMSKSAYSDVSAAKNWLARARNILSEQKVGLTAISNSEAALRNGDWKSAISSLKDVAIKMKFAEQAEALTQARVCLLNAIEALEVQKSSVAKAEIGEAVKAVDKLLSVIP